MSHNKAQIIPPTLVQVPAERLRLNPKRDHKPDSYDDLEPSFEPKVLSALESYLSPSMASNTRHEKATFMEGVLSKYWTQDQANKEKEFNEYRESLQLNYENLWDEIFYIEPSFFFAPEFLQAITDNTIESFRRVMSEPAPGVFTFKMFNSEFCELMISEIQNLKQWVEENNVQILRPNTVNEFGIVLDDFGLESMLKTLLDGCISPIATVFYLEVGGATLDSHHGFAVEYGEGNDSELGLHVDDSEITLDVCLGQQFSGGDLYFSGTRCDQHVNTPRLSEDITFEYAHVPGHAVLYRGRSRHVVRATTSGHIINLILWCRSSIFRESLKYRSNFSPWCDQCSHDKKEKLEASFAALSLKYLENEGI
ncbi:hypothetical protein ACFE04_007362 [Oxalis oulophora]